VLLEEQLLSSLLVVTCMGVSCMGYFARPAGEIKITYQSRNNLFVAYDANIVL
jgi:hypothetical protein